MKNKIIGVVIVALILIAGFAGSGSLFQGRMKIEMFDSKSSINKSKIAPRHKDSVLVVEQDDNEQKFNKNSFYLEESVGVGQLVEPSKKGFTPRVDLLPLHLYNSLFAVREKLEQMSVFNYSTNNNETGYQVVADFLNVYENTYATMDGYVVDNFLTNYFFNKVSDKLFVTAVTHALWLEKERFLPWSLRDYSEYEIEILFWYDDADNYYNKAYIEELEKLEDQVGKEFYASNYGKYVATTKAENILMESIYSTYQLATKFKAQSQKETVINILHWFHQNFFHAYRGQYSTSEGPCMSAINPQEDWCWDHYSDNVDSKVNGYEPASISRIFEERIVGCHETAMILVSMFRTLNIPAIYIGIEDDLEVVGGGKIQGHGVIYLPTLNKYIHGDHVVLASFPIVDEDYLLNFDVIEDAILNHPNERHLYHYWQKVLEDLYGTSEYLPAKRKSSLVQRQANGNNLYLLLLNGYPDDLRITIDEFEFLKGKYDLYNMEIEELDMNNIVRKVRSDVLPIKTLRELSKIIIKPPSSTVVDIPSPEKITLP